jgi:hypothetical protein
MIDRGTWHFITKGDGDITPLRSGRLSSNLVETAMVRKHEISGRPGGRKGRTKLVCPVVMMSCIAVAGDGVD